ncbi:sensor histidine kinase [Candidatus Parcubacteria bacterium]|jgi:signal transduction histidine kinase|nr:MAG: sensor histidine kinase [Candidatus Parcubacteria bacterium]
MTFKSTYLKLTGFYVLIVMLISAVFSLVIYKISSVEINRGLIQQGQIFRSTPFNDFFPSTLDFENLRLKQLREINKRLRTNLIYCNLLILVLATGASYFWARRTIKPIEEMLERQNRFTADASHELRTPLTAMRTEIEVSLRDKALDLPKTKQLLSSNLEEIAKLETLSSALLTLANYEEKPQIIFQKVDLPNVVVEAYQKVESLALKKSIDFENQPQALQILGDQKSLIELFVILFDNAIKYSPEKSRVIISMHKIKNFAQISVKDQGRGIKASDLPYIFNRFYRADASRSKTQVDGFGLGLSIAKRIVELHKGEITVESWPGHGSEFKIKIPIA